MHQLLRLRTIFIQRECNIIFPCIITSYTNRASFKLGTTNSTKRHFVTSTRRQNEKNGLIHHLIQRIKARGPLTVSEYMTAVLTHPNNGYYMQKDVFGKQGDFITSPEISQMFGELLAVWIIHEWSQLGSPSPLQIVELGPGRGTLAEDMLRVFSQLAKHISKDSLSLHLVEVSPKMREMQHAKLIGDETSRNALKKSENDLPEEAVTKTGIPVHWHDSLHQVPRGTSCFIAHEFFDALPIHKFQKTNDGWREVMIDSDGSADQLRFVLSPTPTPASTVFAKPSEVRNDVEICPQAGIIVQELADRISTDGGMALIVDYGHQGEKTDTLRAFKDHKLHDILKDPGTADLTADVDFKYLKEMSGTKVTSYGPVQQCLFLHLMGIQTRLQMLMKSATESQQKDLISGYKMLTEPAQMGERFKMFAMFPHREGYTPAGFPLEIEESI